MLVFVIKNYLNELKDNMGRNKYELIFTGAETGYQYKFSMRKDKDEVAETVLEISTSETSVRSVIKDIHLMDLKDKNLTPVSLNETIFKDEDELYENNFIQIYYPAQLYLKLFRTMKERVSFMFRCEDAYYYAYYVDGKVLYVEETDTGYIMHGTSLYRLGTTHPDYEILVVNKPLKRYQYGEFLDLHHSIAKKKGKEFVKVIKDKVQKVGE